VCDAGAADLFFHIVRRRHEARSIVVTTNLGFKAWSTAFKDASSSAAPSSIGSRSTVTRWTSTPSRGARSRRSSATRGRREPTTDLEPSGRSRCSRQLRRYANSWPPRMFAVSCGSSWPLTRAGTGAQVVPENAIAAACSAGRRLLVVAELERHVPAQIERARTPERPFRHT
jgi:hypothetical protein